MRRVECEENSRVTTISINKAKNLALVQNRGRFARSGEIGTPVMANRMPARGAWHRQRCLAPSVKSPRESDTDRNRSRATNRLQNWRYPVLDAAGPGRRGK